MSKRLHTSFSNYVASRWLQGSLWLLPKGSAKFAVFAIGLGVLVSFLALGGGKGLQQTIFQKVTDFEGDVLLRPLPLIEGLSSDNYLLNNEELPDGVASLAASETAIAVIRTKNAVSGIQLRGTTSEVTRNQISTYLTQGSVSEIGQAGILGIVLSESEARRLSLAVGDTFFTLFTSNNLTLPKQRKSTLLATFRTDFPEFDQSIAWTDFESLRTIVSNANQTEYRVYFKGETNRKATIGTLKNLLSDRFEVVEVASLYPELFHWLSLFDLNRLIILVVVMGVAFFTLITTLISQIIERRISLALLISMGADPSSLRLIFIRIGGYYLQVGLFWGCLLAFMLTSFQNHFGWLTFPNPEEYYSSEIIFLIPLVDWLIYSASFLAAGYLVIFVTSFAIVRIKATSLLRI